MVFFEIVLPDEAVQRCHQFPRRIQLYAVDCFHKHGQRRGVVGDEVVDKALVVQDALPVPFVTLRLADVDGGHGGDGKRRFDRIGKLGERLDLSDVGKVSGPERKIVKLLQELLLENAFFPAYSHQQEVVVRFKFLDELLEELQVFVAFRKELLEIEGEF